MMKKCFLMIVGLIFTLPTWSQNSDKYQSIDNQVGFWDEPGTWIDGNYENDPVNNGYAVIDGQVRWEPQTTADSTLNFNLGGNPPGAGDTALVVRDTLVIYGNLNFANKNNLYIQEGGMLIIYGDLSGDNKIVLDPKGYLIISGDLNFNDSEQGDITTDGDNVYIGGSATNCTDCQNLSNDSTDLVSDSLDVYDYYQGEDPANNGQYTIKPKSTDICNRSPQRVTLYFTDAENVDALFWQVSDDGISFSDSSGTHGEGSLTITSTQTRFYRVQYSTDGGSTFTASDSAVVYCNSLCTMATTVSLSSGPAAGCYTDGMSYEFSSSESDGTAPYTYAWSISPSTNSQGDAISKTENADQVTFVNFTNPHSVSQDYTVTVEVTDDDGCSDTGSQTVTLQRKPETGNTYHVPNEFDKN